MFIIVLTTPEIWNYFHSDHTGLSCLSKQQLKVFDDAIKKRLNPLEDGLKFSHTTCFSKSRLRFFKPELLQ